MDGVISVGAFFCVPSVFFEAAIVFGVNDGESGFRQRDFSVWVAVKDSAEKRQKEIQFFLNKH